MFKRLWNLFLESLDSENKDFTKGSIRRSVFLLAIPMILEMSMESLFAVVDIFFVSKISLDAVAAVGLTESVITIVYAVGMGMSMAITAIVARRIGEKKPEEASKVSLQAILFASIVAIVLGFLGYTYAPDILQLMGATESVTRSGADYTRYIFLGNPALMLIFLINGIFRGAGNAAVAMRSLILANSLNMILDPLLIFGWGPIPAMGIKGAALATTIGRSIGVLYQLYCLTNAKSVIRIRLRDLSLSLKTITQIVKLSAGGTGQFLIDSFSWVLLMRLMAEFGSVALAGYTIAVRIVVFTLLPAWGLSNAASTLVGQNLGAGQPDRAEKSVKKTAGYNMIFLGVVSAIFVVIGSWLIGKFNPDPGVVSVGTEALLIFCAGYLFFAFGMVMVQAFNGAGDTLTPTVINILALWVFQIPCAYLLAKYFGMRETGVFVTIALSHSLHALISWYWFRKGRWKKVKV